MLFEFQTDKFYLQIVGNIDNVEPAPLTVYVGFNNGIEDEKSYMYYGENPMNFAHKIMLDMCEDFWGLKFDSIHQAYSVYFAIRTILTDFDRSWYEAKVADLIERSSSDLAFNYNLSHKYSIKNFVA